MKHKNVLKLLDVMRKRKHVFVLIISLMLSVTMHNLLFGSLKEDSYFFSLAHLCTMNHVIFAIEIVQFREGADSETRKAGMDPNNH